MTETVLAEGQHHRIAAARMNMAVGQQRHARGASPGALPQATVSGGLRPNRLLGCGHWPALGKDTRAWRGVSSARRVSNVFAGAFCGRRGARPVRPLGRALCAKPRGRRRSAMRRVMRRMFDVYRARATMAARMSGSVRRRRTEVQPTRRHFKPLRSYLTQMASTDGHR